jgi:oligosaccharide repeat unit polymerase
MAVESRGLASGHALNTLAGRVLFGLLSLLLYLLVEGWDSLGKPWGPGVSTGLAYAAFALHLLLNRGRVSGFDPILWIPVSMLLFYFGMPIAELLEPGITAGYDAWSIGISPSLERGFAAHLLAFCAFLWGTHLAGTKPLSSGPGASKPDPSLKIPGMLMITGSTGMIFFGIALLGPSIIFSTYDVFWDAKNSGADARWLETGLIFAMSGIFATFATDDPHSRLRRYFAMAITAMVAILLILKGDRSTLVGLGVGAGWCFSQRIRRAPVAITLCAAVFGLMVLPMLKEFRDWRSIEYTLQTSPLHLLASAFAEMGSSALPLAYTLDLIPSIGHYRLGVSYLAAFIDLVPNFGLTPGKSFGIASIDTSGSAWITSILTPDWFANGGGLGYSMDAEWYFNFGMPAVFLGMMFLGWLTGRIRNASSNSALRLVWSAMFFVAMTGYVRNVIGYALRVAIWPIVGMALMKLILRFVGGPPRPSPTLQPIEPSRGVSARA